MKYTIMQKQNDIRPYSANTLAYILPALSAGHKKTRHMPGLRDDMPT